jgi:hypothetical protein
MGYNAKTGNVPENAADDEETLALLDETLNDTASF